MRKNVELETLTLLGRDVPVVYAVKSLFYDGYVSVDVFQTKKAATRHARKQRHIVSIKSATLETLPVGE